MPGQTASTYSKSHIFPTTLGKSIINVSPQSKRYTFTTTHSRIGTRLEYAFNTFLYTTPFGQWNNEDDKALLDFRINWIPKTSSYFYFVANQQYSTSWPVNVLNTTILKTNLAIFIVENPLF